MGSVDRDIKNFFFDRKPVLDMVGRKSAAYINRAAGFTRVTARRSMRPAGKKGKSAAAGEPPRYHARNSAVSLRNIQYGYDPATKTAVIGAVKLASSTAQGKTVPQTQEGGGVVKISRIAKNGKRRQPQTIRVKPHPYMAPALEKTTERFNELWYGASST